MLKKFELFKEDDCLLHKCTRIYWDNIYRKLNEDNLHLYCKMCRIKFPIFYTVGFKILEGTDSYHWVIIGTKARRLYNNNISGPTIIYEIEI